MRIGGSGFSGFSDDKGRSDAFKKGRRPGQKVRGRLIKKVTDDTAWVDIEGHKLLARIQTTAREGTLLSFVIKQLTPSIILKAVIEPSGTGMNALTLASSFDTARTLLENRLRPYAKQLEKTSAVQRKSAFIEQLQADRTLLAAFLDATNCLAGINEGTGTQNSQLRYMPWQIPTARRHVTLVRDKSGLTETITEFDLPNLGMVRSIFLAKGDDAGYRLLLQHKQRGAELKRYLTTRDRSLIPGDIRCLEVGQLPQRSHAGIIAELMFKQ